MTTMLLLDSNVLFWWMTDPTRISQAASMAIEAADKVRLSVASVWELEIKRISGKLALDESAWDDLPAVAIELIDIDCADALAAARLPLHHRDPFDRMIIAQAMTRNLTIVTRDDAFHDYGVPVLKA